MTRTFFIVGPTATGKSEIGGGRGARNRRGNCQRGRVSNLSWARPAYGETGVATLAKAPHHLIGTVPLTEEMNAEKYRRAAMRAIEEINSRGNLAIVVGGSGLYIKALTHGLAPLPESDPELREKLNAMSLDDLRSQLVEARSRNGAKRSISKTADASCGLWRFVLLTGKPASRALACARRQPGGGPVRRWAIWRSLLRTAAGSSIPATGVFVFRDRQELYERINQRVEMMFERGVIEEVRTAGTMSATASQMIGLREIRELLAGKKSIPQCIAEIQQATRRYAKRQLTWFRRQTNFLPLNLSFLTHNEAAKWISLRILSEAGTRDD